MSGQGAPFAPPGDPQTSPAQARADRAEQGAAASKNKRQPDRPCKPYFASHDSKVGIALVLHFVIVQQMASRQGCLHDLMQQQE
jgi:hypothetical protein